MIIDSTIESCGNWCGLVAAFIGCIGFGTFGAPLKAEAVDRVNADPFVLQTYKSTMCFLTSWLVLLLGVEFNFTPYGIISGLMWVTGGFCGIFGIRNAGLAISVGTWSSITVLISFAWGIFVFDEEVQSITGTLFGILMMCIGFIGMAYFTMSSSSSSLPSTCERECECAATNTESEQAIIPKGEEADSDGCGIIPTPLVLPETESEHSGSEASNDNDNDMTARLLDHDHGNGVDGHTGTRSTAGVDLEDPSSLETNTSSEYVSLDEAVNERRLWNQNQNQIQNNEHENDNEDESDNCENDLNVNNNDKFNLFGLQCDRKVIGIIGAAIDGVLGGSNLIPMKLAPTIDRGLDYVISFGIGAAIATLAGWALRLSIASCRQKSLNAGYASLPSMHLSKIIIPGALSGTLWSIGNIGQIMSVTLLGETIGMSIVQSQMIISGILGILWFGEIKGIKMIMGWVLSAIVTFIGIICLSGEHKS
uniref:EamA domain-containing protein n=1 Tax=Chaetoceros debilis TaxID=122233 RepID=A0A7S3Q662_9STRA